MNRRDFVRLGVAGGAGAALSFARASRAGRFRSERVVTVLLGRDGGADLSPQLEALAAGGTLFTRDRGAKTSVRGYVHSALLSGRSECSQRPEHPTWNEIVRKRTGERASKFWMIQSASYHGAWSWDVKHYSRHPDYGIRYGATNLTMNKVFGPAACRAAEAIVDLNVERAIGHSSEEKRHLTAFVEDVLQQSSNARGDDDGDEQPVVVGDRQSLAVAAQVLDRFDPRLVTVQLLGLSGGDARIEDLWCGIQSHPSLRDTTALVLRSSSGNGDGNDWTIALGPDFRVGHVIDDPVDGRDLAPTIIYLITGEAPERAEGRVRTQLFHELFGLPHYKTA